MFACLRSVGSFDEDKASLVSLKYLHSLGVYRDLKPENILLDKTGHVH